MSEDIKEILDRLKDSADNPIVTVFSYDGTDEEPMDNCQCLEPDDCKLLLDYITNLQEYETIIKMEFKREYAKRYLEERRKEEPHLLYPDSDEIYKRYYELKEENKQLEELCDKYEEEHSTTFEKWKKDIEKYQLELEKADSITQSCIFEGSRSAGKSYRQCLNWLEDYKSRNEKAIEILNNSILLLPTEYADEVAKLKRKIRNILQGVDKE